MKGLLYNPQTGITYGSVSGDQALIDKMAEHYGGAGFIETDNETAWKVLPDSTLVEPDRETEPFVRPALALIDFLFLFTQTERMALNQRRPSDPLLNDFWTLLEAAGTIRLDHPSVVGGITYLASVGLISQARAAAVLAGNQPT